MMNAESLHEAVIAVRVAPIQIAGSIHDRIVTARVARTQSMPFFGRSHRHLCSIVDLVLRPRQGSQARHGGCTARHEAVCLETQTLTDDSSHLSAA